MKRHLRRPHVIFFSALVIALLPFVGLPHYVESIWVSLLAVLIIIISAFDLYHGVLWEKSWIFHFAKRLKKKTPTHSDEIFPEATTEDQEESE